MLNNISEITEALNNLTNEVKLHFAHLNIEQLNYKPNETAWSIAQCLNHLIVANQTYYPQLKQIINGQHKNSFYQRVGFIADWMGNRLLKDIDPQTTTAKFKNPTVFAPSASHFSKSIVSEFETHQHELIALIQQLPSNQLQHAVISSPAAGVIIYRLVLALNIIVAHEKRHLAQALRISYPA